MRNTCVSRKITLFYLNLIVIFFSANLGAQQVLQSTQSGVIDELYYTFWQDSGSASMTLVGDGRYKSQWGTDTNNWIGGLGWQPAQPMLVEYTGEFNPDPDKISFVALYGLSRDPYIQFYVVESFSVWHPGLNGTYYGSYRSDGIIYDAFYTWTIVGGINGRQLTTLTSVRRNALPPGPLHGTITIDNHYAAWAEMGIDFSPLEFVVLATEGYQGSGSSDITVSGEYGCGWGLGGMTCCSTMTDRDGDGLGSLLDGRSCNVLASTEGAHPSNPEEVIAAINLGGVLNAIEEDGIWYSPNTHVYGGVSRSTLPSPEQNDLSSVLQSEQRGEFTIDIPIGEGHTLVEVELGFSSNAIGHEGESEFQVIMEGKPVLTNLDYIGDSAWKPSPVLLTVSDGQLNIHIKPIHGEGVLSSVLVKQATPEPLSITSNDRGEFGDKYYYYWSKDTTSDASLTLLNNNRFTAQWDSNVEHWVGGLGWIPTGEKRVTYTGAFNPEEGANAYFGLFGWAEAPYNMFFIIESYVGNIPGFTEYRTHIGEYVSEGESYDLYAVRQHPDNIAGPPASYFSIRKQPISPGQVQGSVNTASHFRAWRNLNVNLGELVALVVATEAVQSGGKASITIGESPLDCGVTDDLPVCCDISADKNRDGYGEQFDGQMCLVTEATKGWHPPNPENILAAINVGADGDPMLLDGIWYSAFPDANCSGYFGTSQSLENSDSLLHRSACEGSVDMMLEGLKNGIVDIELSFYESEHNNDQYQRDFDVVFNDAVQLDNENLHEYVDFMTLRPSVFEGVEVVDGTLKIQVLTQNPNLKLSSVVVTAVEAPDQQDDEQSSSASSSAKEDSAGGSINPLFIILLLLTGWLRHRPFRRRY